MKTNRRRFFAALLAPLLGRLMPKKPDCWHMTEVAEWTYGSVARNVLGARRAALNQFMVPPINVDSLAMLTRKQLTLQLVVQKYLPKEVLLEEDPQIET